LRSSFAVNESTTLYVSRAPAVPVYELIVLARHEQRQRCAVAALRQRERDKTKIRMYTVKLFPICFILHISLHVFNGLFLHPRVSFFAEIYSVCNTPKYYRVLYRSGHSSLYRKYSSVGHIISYGSLSL